MIESPYGPTFMSTFMPTSKFRKRTVVFYSGPCISVTLITLANLCLACQTKSLNLEQPRRPLNILMLNAYRTVEFLHVYLIELNESMIRPVPSTTPSIPDSHTH